MRTLMLIIALVLFIRLKSWLRSRMSEQRLTGLTLLNLHQNETSNTDYIIDCFAASNKSVLDFVI